MAAEKEWLAMTTFSYATILNVVLDEANHGGIFECEHDVNENQLLGSYRATYLVKLRCCLAVLCFRHLAKGSYSQIARLMHREHSGICYLIHTYAIRHAAELGPLLDAMEERLMRGADRADELAAHDTHQGVPFQ
jgi:hypothetical protein